MYVFGCDHQDCAIRTHGQRRAEGLLVLFHTNRYCDHLIGLPRLFQADRLLDSDFVERVHRHFYIGQIDAATVRFNTDFHVIIDHTFDRH